MVVEEQDKCTRFEFGLRFELIMQRVFEALVEKTKLCEEVKRIECKRKEKARALLKRESSLNVTPLTRNHR
ncbi:hypothetical protein EPI10_021099 [Gossypium australe]|uniref:Uncharacterized protein n=1 Tax=Gossypium australe TaxID=47621 RepID=A0A5B6WIG5_9ROSI|nr:hypothetical protein EPI10_021099 [Gossypium australe]